MHTFEPLVIAGATTGQLAFAHTEVLVGARKAYH